MIRWKVVLEILECKYNILNFWIEFFVNKGFVECLMGMCVWMKINGIEV